MMRKPTVRDRGQSVDPDLHGANILLRRTLPVSLECGHSSVKVIHGYSTNVDPRKGASIRNKFYGLLGEGALTEVQGYHRFDGSAIPLSGDLGIRDRRPTTMRNITGVG